jgi:hypothetical protein
VKVDNVRIRLDDDGKGEVWINDMKLAATTSIRVVCGVNCMTWVTVKMLANVDFEGQAVITQTAGDEIHDEAIGNNDLLDVNTPYHDDEEMLELVRDITELRRKISYRESILNARFSEQIKNGLNHLSDSSNFKDDGN